MSGPEPEELHIDLTTVRFGRDVRVLVLAPHPDDFDCIAATMRMFRDNDNAIEVVVLAGAASGVEDEFCSPPTIEKKIEVREAEQRESCRRFGLSEARVDFLRLEEDAEGHLVENAAAAKVIRSRLRMTWPDAVFLPHPNDSNADHRRTYRMFRNVARATHATLVAFLNEDPKTIGMQSDAYVAFDAETAQWKAELLRCHRSQHERNLRSRGHGLDQRILSVNRAAAERCALEASHAEVFELEFWDEGLRMGLAGSAR